VRGYSCTIVEMPRRLVVYLWREAFNCLEALYSNTVVNYNRDVS
jgi:hypothetical protein